PPSSHWMPPMRLPNSSTASSLCSTSSDSARLSYELYSSNHRDRGILLGCPLAVARYAADLRYRCSRYRRIDHRPTHHLRGFWTHQRCRSSNCQLLIIADYLSDPGAIHLSHQCCDAVVDRLGHIVFA